MEGAPAIRRFNRIALSTWQTLEGRERSQVPLLPHSRLSKAGDGAKERKRNALFSQRCLQILIGRGDRLDVEILNEHL